MRRSLRFVLVSSMTALLASASVGVAKEVSAADDAGSASLPACVQVSSSARYVPYGYNHIVSVKNGCSKIATCAVRTDVNPQATTVEVAPGVTSEVVTFVASPSQIFTPYVTCTMQ